MYLSGSMKAYFLVLSFLFLGGCQLLGDPIALDDVLLSDDVELPPHKDAYHIQSVDVQGDVLEFSVSYSGGCEEHEFELHSAAGWTYSNPPGKHIVLIHNANGDTCEAALREDLSFDISQLRNPVSDEVQLFIWPFESDTVYTPVPRYRY